MDDVKMITRTLGMIAYARGKKTTDNPFELESDQYGMWLEGWYIAKIIEDNHCPESLEIATETYAIVEYTKKLEMEKK